MKGKRAYFRVIRGRGFPLTIHRKSHAGTQVAPEGKGRRGKKRKEPPVITLDVRK